MVYRNYNLFGQVLLDKVAMMAGLNNKFTFSFEGDDYIRGMKDGGLLISAHMGNWEIAGQMLNMFEKKVNVILFDAEHQQIKGYLDDVMTERNVHFIVIRDDFSHLTEIRDAFANKEIVAMHGDRYLDGNRTMVIDFLGMPAAFPTGPLNLAAKFGVPVSFVFGIKTQRTHYHFCADKPRNVEFLTNLKQRESYLKVVLSEFVQNLEQKVRNYPLQWFNYYDFWALPSGRPARINTSH
jgi:predicted LPLAT superfamily acyltransferase